MTDFDYDLFVIGAGSGGVRASRVAASLGARVAVAEERYLGGTCVNVGCVPKKLFSHAAHFSDDFADSAGFGWHIADARFDWGTLQANKDHEINRLNKLYQSLLDQHGVVIYRHRARLAGSNRIAMGSECVTARYILLAVGGRPWIPAYPGSEYAVSSNDIFALSSLPQSIAVVGGGYIAVEFASIFAGLGRETTLIYRGDKLLRGFDEDVRKLITTRLATRTDLKLGTAVMGIEKDGHRLRLQLNDKTGKSCELVLSATGRRPSTADLGLDKVAVQTDQRGAIQVDYRYQTHESGIYAIGDVIDRVALTPVALAEGEVVARHLFGDQSGHLHYNNIPTAVFCHPNVACCGLTEAQAREQQLDVAVYLSTFKPLKYSLGRRDEQSLVKLIVDRTSDQVIGAHIVAEDAGELMQGIAVAMNAGATKAQFDSTLGIHPTLAEELVTMREPVVRQT